MPVRSAASTHNKSLIIDHCACCAVQDGEHIVCHRSAVSTYNTSPIINHHVCCTVRDGVHVVCRRCAASTYNKSLIINHFTCHAVINSSAHHHRMLVQCNVHFHCTAQACKPQLNTQHIHITILYFTTPLTTPLITLSPTLPHPCVFTFCIP